MQLKLPEQDRYLNHTIQLTCAIRENQSKLKVIHYKQYGALDQGKDFIMSHQLQNIHQVEELIDSHIERITELQQLLDEEEQALFLCQQEHKSLLKKN